MFPSECRTCRGDRAGKTCTALLEMRTAPQKQCETNLLLQSVLLKTLSGYLYFAVCKQLVVPIHFTGLPNELREIIALGSYVLTTSQIFSRPALPLSQ